MDNIGLLLWKSLGGYLTTNLSKSKDVFVIATANSIESLPPELVRKGRFDEIFFVDLPNINERKELLKLYSNKYLKVELGENLQNKLIEITEGFSSADIEATMRAITYKLIANPELKLSEELIVNELSRVVSLSKTNPEKIQEIRAWGKERAINASK